jgi:hypothetical protein
MSLNNPIVYFEEDGDETVTNYGYDRIMDMTPNVNDNGKIVSVYLNMERRPTYGTYYISYQRSFKFRFADGQEVEIKGTIGDVEDDEEFGNKFLKFVEDYHNGKYENKSNLQVVDEVEFMDI